MEVDLRAPCQGTASDTAERFFARVEVEVAVAKTFAAALNALLARHEEQPGAVEAVELPVRILLPAFLGEARAGVPPGWSRAVKDDFARCVDRALTRVYPPIDPLAYLSGDSPSFTHAEGKPTASLVATFKLSMNGSGQTAVHYFVENERDGEGREVAAPAFLLRRVDTAALEASALGASGRAHEAPTRVEDDRNAEDEDLWRRARASRAKTAFLDALASSPHVSAADERLQTDKRAKLVRRLARHATERMVNESSWATPALPNSSHHPTSASSAHANAGGRRGAGTVHAPSYVSFLANGSARFRTALEAASKRESAKRVGDGRARDVDGDRQTKTALRGVLHADVRGMEFTGLVAACTTRYAYIACHGHTGAPSTAAKGREGELVLVTRVPVPSWLAGTCAGAQAAEPLKGSNARQKRSREAFAESPAIQALARRFGNFEEATLHDDLDGFIDLSASGEACTMVDIRAHRVLVKALAGTQRIALWFEDAFLVNRHEESSAVDAGSAEVSSFRELIDLVNASCTRYAAERAKLQDMWRAMQAEEKEDAVLQAKKLKSRQQQQQQQQTTTEGDDARDRGDAMSEDASVGSGAVAVSENDEHSSAPTKPLAGEHKSIEVANENDEGDEAKAARLHRQQSLRLFAAMDAVMRAMMDPSAIVFAKLRPSDAKASATRLPELRSCKDIQALEEGPCVEFKYALSTKGGGSIMDAQRLRNTMAAMAGTLGGVICVGVSDDGTVVGQPQGEVRTALRVSGFCPAMTNNAVTLRDVRVLREAQESGGSEPARAMPKDWWKTPAHSIASGASTVSSEQVAKEGQRVVTVVTISKGAAPFYASGRSALPYVRGCASTTPMPTRLMCDRIYRELAASADPC